MDDSQWLTNRLIRESVRLDGGGNAAQQIMSTARYLCYLSVYPDGHAAISLCSLLLLLLFGYLYVPLSLTRYAWFCFVFASLFFPRSPPSHPRSFPFFTIFLLLLFALDRWPIHCRACTHTQQACSQETQQSEGNRQIFKCIECVYSMFKRPCLRCNSMHIQEVHCNAHFFRFRIK